mmetsp:Transcript_127792/g.409228  ORF Transcript_127792/g.409228 Transcript_127792/m.409228 type:complete len:302 (-) Transcript_127792:873-1778(-)
MAECGANLKSCKLASIPSRSRAPHPLLPNICMPPSRLPFASKGPRLGQAQADAASALRRPGRLPGRRLRLRPGPHPLEIRRARPAIILRKDLREDDEQQRPAVDKLVLVERRRGAPPLHHARHTIEPKAVLVRLAALELHLSHHVEADALPVVRADVGCTIRPQPRDLRAMVRQEDLRRGLREEPLAAAGHHALVEDGDEELGVVPNGACQSAVPAGHATPAGEHCAMAPLHEAILHRPELCSGAAGSKAASLRVPVEAGETAGFACGHGEAGIAHAKRLEDLTPQEGVEREPGLVLQDKA